jgi:hypothetical protein
MISNREYIIRFVFCILLASASASAEQFTLDLRNVRASEKRSMGVPGARVSAMSGGGPTSNAARYDLPIEVRIGSLVANREGRTIAVELELVNSGVSALRVPICADGEKAHASQERGRRTMQIWLEFASAAKKEHELLDATYGSDSNKNCSVVLKPHDILKILDSVSVRDEQFLGDSRATAKALVSETKLEDARYFIQAYSKPVESDSARIKD